MRRTTTCPLRKFSTITFVPSFSDGCAAVMPYMSYTSPFAVFRPWKPGPYQDALPCITALWLIAHAGTGAAVAGKIALHRNKNRKNPAAINIFIFSFSSMAMWCRRQRGIFLDQYREEL